MSDYESVLEDTVSMDSAGGGGAGAAGYGSGLIGGILDAIIGPVMSNVNYIRGKSPTNRQTGYMQFLAENQPSWAVSGLIKAGINPLLALGRGPFGGSMPPQMARAEGGVSSNLGSVMSRGVSNVRQMELLNSQADMLRSQAETARNEANASRYLDTKMMAEIAEIGARMENLDQQSRTGASQENLNRSSELVNRWESRLRAAAVPGAEAEAELYRTETGEKMKQFGPFIKLVNQLLGRGGR